MLKTFRDLVIFLIVFLIMESILFRIANMVLFKLFAVLISISENGPQYLHFSTSFLATCTNQGR